MSTILIVGGQHRAAKQYAESLMDAAVKRGEVTTRRNRRSNRFRIGDQDYAFFGPEENFSGWSDGTQVLTVVSAAIPSVAWKRIYAICPRPQEVS